MVKDEADVIGPVVAHLLRNVDEVAVADNGSTDGTREILRDLPVLLSDDLEVGYWQSRKMTAMAVEARRRGHKWVIPCDADEVWYSPDGRRVADYLDGLTPDVSICKATLFNHLPSGLDPEGEEDPTKRIGWRQRQHGALPKVAVRPEDDLVIHPGNHGATARGMSVSGLTIRHFSWRSPEQYVRKIRNGAGAYAGTDLPESIGTHWRMFDNATDEELREWYLTHFWIENPDADSSLIYDPAPVWR